MIKELVKAKLIDYIAMDIKAPLSKYSKTVNIKVDTKKIKESIKVIMNSGLPYEFRSTIMPELHSAKDLEQMAKLVTGADAYYLQKFIPSGNLNNQEFNKLISFTSKEMKALAKLCKPYVKKCQAR